MFVCRRMAKINARLSRAFIFSDLNTSLFVSFPRSRFSRDETCENYFLFFQIFFHAKILYLFYEFCKIDVSCNLLKKYQISTVNKKNLNDFI